MAMTSASGVRLLSPLSRSPRAKQPPPPPPPPADGHSTAAAYAVGSRALAGSGSDAPGAAMADNGDGGDDALRASPPVPLPGQPLADTGADISQQSADALTPSSNASPLSAAAHSSGSSASYAADHPQQHASSATAAPSPSTTPPHVSIPVDTPGNGATQTRSDSDQHVKQIERMYQWLCCMRLHRTVPSDEILEGRDRVPMHPLDLLSRYHESRFPHVYASFGSRVALLELPHAATAATAASVDVSSLLTTVLLAVLCPLLDDQANFSEMLGHIVFNRSDNVGVRPTYMFGLEMHANQMHEYQNQLRAYLAEYLRRLPCVEHDKGNLLDFDTGFNTDNQWLIKVVNGCHDVNNKPCGDSSCQHPPLWRIIPDANGKLHIFVYLRHILYQRCLAAVHGNHSGDHLTNATIDPPATPLSHKGESSKPLRLETLAKLIRTNIHVYTAEEISRRSEATAKPAATQATVWDASVASTADRPAVVPVSQGDTAPLSTASPVGVKVSPDAAATSGPAAANVESAIAPATNESSCAAADGATGLSPASATATEPTAASTAPVATFTLCDVPAKASAVINLATEGTHSANRMVVPTVALLRPRQSAWALPHSWSALLPSQQLPLSVLLGGGVLLSELCSAFDLSELDDVQHANDAPAILKSLFVHGISGIRDSEDRRRAMAETFKDKADKLRRDIHSKLGATPPPNQDAAGQAVPAESDPGPASPTIVPQSPPPAQGTPPPNAYEPASPNTQHARATSASSSVGEGGDARTCTPSSSSESAGLSATLGTPADPFFPLESVFRLQLKSMQKVKQPADCESSRLWFGRCMSNSSACTPCADLQFFRRFLRALGFESVSQFSLVKVQNARLRLLNLWDLFLLHEGLADTHPTLSYAQLYACLRTLLEHIYIQLPAEAGMDQNQLQDKRHALVIDMIRIVKRERLLTNGFFFKDDFPGLLIFVMQQWRARRDVRSPRVSAIGWPQTHDDAASKEKLDQRQQFTQLEYELTSLVARVNSSLTASRKFDWKLMGYTLLYCALPPLFLFLTWLGHEKWKAMYGWMVDRSLDHVLVRRQLPEIKHPAKRRFVIATLLLFGLPLANLIMYYVFVAPGDTVTPYECLFPVLSYAFLSLLLATTAGRSSTNLLVRIKLDGIRRSLCELHGIQRREKGSGESMITNGETVLDENILTVGVTESVRVKQQTALDMQAQPARGLMRDSWVDPSRIKEPSGWQLLILFGHSVYRSILVGVLVSVVALLHAFAPLLIRHQSSQPWPSTPVSHAVSALYIVWSVPVVMYVLLRMSAMASEFNALTAVHERLLSSFTTSLFQSHKLVAKPGSGQLDFNKASKHHISLTMPEHVLCYSLLRRYLLTACQSGVDLLTARLICSLMGVAAVGAALVVMSVRLDRRQLGSFGALHQLPSPAILLAFVLAVVCVLALHAASRLNGNLERHAAMVAKAQLDIHFAKDELAAYAQRWSWQLQQEPHAPAIQNKSYGALRRRVEVDVYGPEVARAHQRVASGLARSHRTPPGSDYESALAPPPPASSSRPTHSPHALSACFTDAELASMRRSVLSHEHRDRVSVQELERARLLLEGVHHSIQFADKPVEIMGFPVSSKLTSVTASALASGLIALFERFANT